MDTPDDDTRIQPSGICRMGHHQWRHPEGGKRLVCDRCRSMSMNNYGAGCRTDCVECNPPTPVEGQ